MALVFALFLIGTPLVLAVLDLLRMRASRPL
ncbi:hypothetical protein J2X36_004062 [Methylobacterium sp. BE186]|nr:hypothetical protein [Methylobacterium sp. BE186]